MAEFSLDGRMTVKGLKENFKKCFGATLRVYTTPACKTFADDKATLASIRKGDAKGGALKVGGNLRVGSFEKNCRKCMVLVYRLPMLLIQSFPTMTLHLLLPVKNNINIKFNRGCSCYEPPFYRYE